uniref:Mytilin-B n=2 Tax=Mytilus TaxID=6548 RepID=MYTB_MYTED|nr:RecName: Full=Mytilin-B [Mytilus edulis]2EEM_A Chain A, Mytilin-B [synthetic construct]
SCASRCKGHCRARRCGYYVSVLYRGRCYCKCLRC